MQLLERVPDCNGCGACVVGCKDRCVKMIKDENGYFRPVVDEGGCNKCNNCILYCPLYNPVELPEFSQYYDYSDDYYNRDMPKTYRATLREAKTGKVTEFAGTLCQIAGLKSLMGDKLRPNLKLYPLHCDPDEPKRPECVKCQYIKR
ncbi:4Fe-4S dicluster domain-containing protein [Aminicella lysinilytica]|uniref:4Fe-4S ferredoxin-type domain-containing protein n=1 Tax=Aminicella lysinilytica TaxID=433323 RepID=A0A4R6QCS8_9FIRM|nr:ferredoxin family protein [Aminicella lysinilytica]NLD10386.1 hypothetical protein [Clostridiales bacterium]TDP59653.1 hypothetical protein EV211_10380 [Aminicella lysinilytica]